MSEPSKWLHRLWSIAFDARAGKDVAANIEAWSKEVAALEDVVDGARLVVSSALTDFDMRGDNTVVMRRDHVRYLVGALARLDALVKR
jgi:hypothetical protein